MKIRDILVENLGNLASLNAGNLIKLLNQEIRYSSRREEYPSLYGLTNKFTNKEIGSTSEIVDIGVLKGGIKGLRKAYRDAEKADEEAHGFCLYINNRAVVLGLYNQNALAGPSRYGRLAYDLSAFQSEVEQVDQDAKAAMTNDWDRNRYRNTKISTVGVKQRPWPFEDQPPVLMIGTIESTQDLIGLLEKLELVAKKANGAVTAKIILRDRIAARKRIDRQRIEYELTKAAVDLQTRLKAYKNSLKPKVDNIEDLIKMSLDKPARSVQFDGYTYSLIPQKNYFSDITAPDLLMGKAFIVEYKCIDPDTAGNLSVTFAFDRFSNQLLPLSATWRQRGTSTSITAVIDKTAYLRNVFKVKDVDKDTIVPLLLARAKRGEAQQVLQLIAHLRTAGEDWPELKVIQKQMTAVMNSKKASGT